MHIYGPHHMAMIAIVLSVVYKIIQFTIIDFAINAIRSIYKICYRTKNKLIIKSIHICLS